MLMPGLPTGFSLSGGNGMLMGDAVRATSLRDISPILTSRGLRSRRITRSCCRARLPRRLHIITGTLPLDTVCPNMLMLYCLLSTRNRNWRRCFEPLSYPMLILLFWLTSPASSSLTPTSTGLCTAYGHSIPSCVPSAAARIDAPIPPLCSRSFTSRCILTSRCRLQTSPAWSRESRTAKTDRDCWEDRG